MKEIISKRLKYEKCVIKQSKLLLRSNPLQITHDLNIVFKGRIFFKTGEMFDIFQMMLFGCWNEFV